MFDIDSLVSPEKAKYTKKWCIFNGHFVFLLSSRLILINSV